MSNYLLTFDFADDKVKLTQLTAFIRVNRSIDGWHSPFTGTYLIKSDATLNVLQKDFVEFFGEVSFLLIIAEAGKMTGVLPKTVWDWINTGLASVATRLSRITGEPSAGRPVRYRIRPRISSDPEKE